MSEELEKEVKPYEKNAKKHPDKQLLQIAKSIKEFGWQQPIVVDKEGIIIVGHGRWFAFEKYGKELKMDEPRVEVAYNLTEEQVNAYRLADNKLNESDWDMGLAIDELKELSPELLDLTGFDKDFVIGNLSGIGWNPEKTEEAELGDGINELVGYGLQSFWKDIKNEHSELFKFWIELPLQEKQNLIRQKYSRTNLEEIRRVIKTYMREGDYFLENCCGWSTFSCSAVLQGYNGVGVDIWDTAVEHGNNQYDHIKHIEGCGKYKAISGDGLNLQFEDETFDFVYCNPPFMDEEKYSGFTNDIASKDFGKFENSFVNLQSENYRVLKKDNLCVITINDKREQGYLIPLQKYIIEWSERVGFKLWDFVIAEVQSQKIRLRKKDYSLRRTVKCHEYVIVFKKP